MSCAGQAGWRLSTGVKLIRCWTLTSIVCRLLPKCQQGLQGLHRCLVMLDPLMITRYPSSGRVGDGPTRNTVCQSVCSEKKKEDMRKEQKAWIAGGCVPLVQVSPFSAGTDGPRTGVEGYGGQGRLGEVAWPAWQLPSGRPVRVEHSEMSRAAEVSCLQFPVVPVSLLHSFSTPHPTAIPRCGSNLFPMGSLSDGVVYGLDAVLCSMHLRRYTQSQMDSYVLYCRSPG